MPARKRTAPEADIVAVEAPSRRRSGRLSSTLQKSKYFEASDDDDASPSMPPKKRGRPSIRKQESEEQYEEEDDENDDDFEDKEEDEEDEQENGVDEDDDSADDEDARPRVKILPLEKMRDTGGVEYQDKTLHKNTLLFLRDLKANNVRSWLKAHDGEYRRSLKDWNSFVEELTMTLIDVDETIPELPVKDVSFRIHRDIRFSKDPTPYKPHFSAAFSRTGRKGPYACYYIHCEPKNSFIGGGLWCPERDHLAKLRRSIDRHPTRWRQALNIPEFKRTFYPSIKPSAGAEKVVQAFQETNQSTALKRRPQGYEMDHRDIKLLCLKNFTVIRKLDDSIFYGDDAQEKIADIMRGLLPFVTFLNDIVMPDPSRDEDSSSEEEQEADEDGNESD